MSDFRTRTIHALSWSLGSKFVSQAISVVFGIVLARLLVPEDFGLLAMVIVLMGFAGLLADVGLGSALVQKKDITDRHYSSVFWINNAVGLILMLGLGLSSTFVAEFYGRPELEMITMVLSVNFLIGGLAMVPSTKLTKELAFRELSIIQLTSMVLSGLIAIVMAFKGYGYWSLVAMQISERALATVLLWSIGRWKPIFCLDMDATRDLIGFSGRVFFTRVLQYISRNSAQLLIGKFLGAPSLGLQDKAYSMMLFPVQNISHVIGGVMFPSFSQIQDDKERVKDIYLKLIRAVSLVTFPMMLGMYVVSDAFVLGVLGEQWYEVIPLLKVYCITGLVVSIVTLNGAIYMSQGAAKLQLQVNLFIQPMLIACVAVGLLWGVIGVVIGYAVANYIGAVITWVTAGRLIRLSIYEILTNLLPSLLISIVMAVIVKLANELLVNEGPLIQFVFQMAVGVCVYPCLLVLVKPRGYQEIRGVLKEKFMAGAVS